MINRFTYRDSFKSSESGSLCFYRDHVKELEKFLDYIRDYEYESGETIGLDDRSSNPIVSPLSYS